MMASMVSMRRSVWKQSIGLFLIGGVLGAALATGGRLPVWPSAVVPLLPFLLAVMTGVAKTTTA